MDMSEKIAMLRKQRGMTLEQVGEIVGVGKSTVRKWENGMIANMRRDKIALLAQALGVTPAYLMGWEDNVTPMPKALTDTERQLLAAFRALNADGQKFVLSTVEMCSNNPSMKKDSASTAG